MVSEVLATVRALLYAGALVFVAYMVVPLFHHAAPVTQPNSTATVQQVLDAAQKIATLEGGKAPVYAQPAVTVVRDAIPQAKSLSDAEIYAILSALKPKTQTAISNKLVGPSPVPQPTAAPGLTTDQAKFYYSTAYAADVAAINSSHIQTTISQQPVEPGRIGTDIHWNGDSGISYDVLRRGQLNLSIAALAHGSQIRPAVAIPYCFRGTQLCGGIQYEIGHSVGAVFQIKL